MTKTTKLIPDGEEQIVLIPDEFRFNTEQVWIKRVGEAVILQAMEGGRPDPPKPQVEPDSLPPPPAPR